MTTRQAPAVPHALLLIEIVNIADVAAYQGDDWADLFWPKLAREICDGDDGLLSKFNSPQSFMFGDATLAVIIEEFRWRNRKAPASSCISMRG